MVVNLQGIIDFALLVKISKLEYLKSIQSGKLYMNNLKYYVDLEKTTGEQGIGDVQEASWINIKKHKLFIQVEGEERKEMPIGPAPGIIYDEEALYHPVFCMMFKLINLQKENETQSVGQFQLSKEELADFIDNDIGALIITDVGEFLNRVQIATREIGIAGKHGAVNYRDKRVPNIVNGGIQLDDSFTKDLRFQKQSEFRIELFTQRKEAMILDIGDIHDISFIAKGDRIFDKLSIIFQQYIE